MQIPLVPELSGNPGSNGDQADGHMATSADIKNWFALVRGQQYGPFTFASLVRAAGRGVFGPEAGVWCVGWAEWRIAGSVPGLFEQEPEPDGVEEAHRSKEHREDKNDRERRPRRGDAAPSLGEPSDIGVRATARASRSYQRGAPRRPLRTRRFRDPLWSRMGGDFAGHHSRRTPAGRCRVNETGRGLAGRNPDRTVMRPARGRRCGISQVPHQVPRIRVEPSPHSAIADFNSVGGAGRRW